MPRMWMNLQMLYLQIYLQMLYLQTYLQILYLHNLNLQICKDAWEFACLKYGSEI